MDVSFHWKTSTGKVPAEWFPQDRGRHTIRGPRSVWLPQEGLHGVVREHKTTGLDRAASLRNTMDYSHGYANDLPRKDPAQAEHHIVPAHPARVHLMTAQNHNKNFIPCELGQLSGTRKEKASMSIDFMCSSASLRRRLCERRSSLPTPIWSK